MMIPYVIMSYFWIEEAFTLHGEWIDIDSDLVKSLLVLSDVTNDGVIRAIIAGDAYVSALHYLSVFIFELMYSYNAIITHK